MIRLPSCFGELWICQEGGKSGEVECAEGFCLLLLFKAYCQRDPARKMRNSLVYGSLYLKQADFRPSQINEV